MVCDLCYLTCIVIWNALKKAWNTSKSATFQKTDSIWTSWQLTYAAPLQDMLILRLIIHRKQQQSHCTRHSISRGWGCRRAIIFAGCWLFPWGSTPLIHSFFGSSFDAIKKIHVQATGCPMRRIILSWTKKHRRHGIMTSYLRAAYSQTFDSPAFPPCRWLYALQCLAKWLLNFKQKPSATNLRDYWKIPCYRRLATPDSANDFLWIALNFLMMMSSPWPAAQSCSLSLYHFAKQARKTTGN